MRQWFWELLADVWQCTKLLVLCGLIAAAGAMCIITFVQWMLA